MEALQVVLADIERRGITDIVCLGDVIGYGPSPLECLDLVREKCRICLMGNHDHAVLYEPTNFNTAAESAAYWTRAQLEGETKADKRSQRWDFLGKRPVRVRENGILYVHASPRRPINEYIFPEDVFTNPQKVLSNFERLDGRLCFVGHTHQPGVFLDDPYFDPPDELPDSPYFELDDERAIINVGSVGQPRDQDPRASYVVVYSADDETPEGGGGGKRSLVDQAAGFDVDQLEFVRLEYDIEATVKRILAEPELDDMLGHRLFEGR
jgi:diadenosine tetraphosphatase ApaH/serine/threonine PP2A family protein phosphatase